ncbi:MAG: dTMP kinase [Rhodobacteraceae bacterium]|nr:dTMP kinase [Paracoccaceae bacterium]
MPHSTTSAGFFVTLEGIDGCGKSTQAKLLAEAFRSLGKTVVATREPGGSPGAEEIRPLLVEGHKTRWLPETEFLLFTAARFEHFRIVIGPALSAGKIVVCDRYVDSTRIYQGVVRSDLRRLVDLLHERLGIRPPDLTILLDLDPEMAFERRQATRSSEMRFESFGKDFQRKARQAFLGLANENPERIKVIDATCALEIVAQQVFEAALEKHRE